MTPSTIDVHGIVAALPTKIEFDEAVGYWVAQCPHAGNVATADDRETAISMLTELLTNEVLYAIQFGTLDRLLYPPMKKPAHS